MSNERPGMYFVGSLITSLLGAIMLLVSDFAGWEYRVRLDPGIFIYPGDSIYLFDSPLYFVIIGGFIALLVYGAYVSYGGLRSGNAPLPRRRLQRAYWAAAIVAVGSLIAGVIFIVSMVIEDPLDWWLDSGFYSGVVAGGLTALFFRLALKSVPD